jgi:hypothetical protein
MQQPARTSRKGVFGELKIEKVTKNKKKRRVKTLNKVRELKWRNKE